jgi:hypothetical protein
VAKAPAQAHRCEETPVFRDIINESSAPLPVNQNADDNAAPERVQSDSSATTEENREAPLQSDKEQHGVGLSDRILAPQAQVQTPVQSHDHDPFRACVQIPGCSPTTFVYPHSNTIIPPSFRERYLEVLYIFRRNTEEDPQLRDNVHFIDYTLRMCGPSPGNVHPSIVVFCRPNKEFKALSALLTSKELKYQYCLRKPSRKYPWTGRQDPSLEGDRRPFFNLYFWRQRRPRTLLRWHRLPAVIHHADMLPESQEGDPVLRYDLTLSGSQVEYLGGESTSSIATVGCVVKIDSSFCAITSMHVFSSPRSEYIRTTDTPSLQKHSPGCGSTAATEVSTQPVCAWEPPTGSETDGSDACFNDDGYFVDDISYESIDEDDDDHNDDDGSNVLGGSAFAAGNCYSNEAGGGRSEPNQRLITPSLMLEEPCPYSGVDLDWALIDLPDRKNWRPNAFLSPDTGKPVFLRGTAEASQTQETEVFILTGEMPPRRGMLQPGISMLGGINGKSPSMVWTTVMAEGEGETTTDLFSFPDTELRLTCPSLQP